MNSYNFTEEEINKILLSSPMVLPNNPSEYGLKGNNIKTFFYEFIRKMMLLLNEHFILIKRDKENSFLTHNEGENAHPDIRRILQNLAERDIELGNEIENHYEKANSDNEEMRQNILENIQVHNSDKLAHTLIQNEVSNIKKIAENALNTAQGKSRVYPVKDVIQMIDTLSESINIGDRFVLSDKNIPDFTLFEKGSQSEDGIVITKDNVLGGNIQFSPGETYLYNGYLLVATESGIDTSLLVNKEEFELLEIIVSELDMDIENGIKMIESKLAKKEDTYSMVTSSNENVTLQNKTEFNLGLRTKVNLVLPVDVSSDFECIVNFRSGENATTFTCEGVIMTQDDCYEGVLTPYKNRIYEINIKSVDGVLIGKVSATLLQ